MLNSLLVERNRILLNQDTIKTSHYNSLESNLLLVKSFVPSILK